MSGGKEKKVFGVSLPESQTTSVSPAEGTDQSKQEIQAKTRLDIAALKAAVSLSELKSKMGLDETLFSDLSEALPFPDGLSRNFDLNFADAAGKDALAKDILAHFEKKADANALSALAAIVEFSVADFKEIFSGVYAVFIVKDLEAITGKGGKYEKIGEFLAARADYGLKYLVKDKKVYLQAEGKDFDADYQKFVGEGAKPETAEPKKDEAKPEVKGEVKGEEEKKAVVDELQEKVSAIKSSALGGFLKFLGYDKVVPGQEHSGFEKIALGQDVVMGFLLGMCGVAGFSEGYDQLKESLPAEIQAKIKPFEKAAREKEQKKRDRLAGKEAVAASGPVEKTANEVVNLVENKAEVPKEGIKLKEDTLFNGDVLVRLKGEGMKIVVPKGERYLVAEEKADFAPEAVLSTAEVEMKDQSLKLSKLPKGTVISGGVKFESYQA